MSALRIAMAGAAGLCAEDTEQAAKAGRPCHGNTESTHSRFPFLLLAATAMAFSAPGRRPSESPRSPPPPRQYCSTQPPWPHGRQRCDLVAGLFKDVAEQRWRYVGQANENCWIIAIVVGEEECARIQFHEHFTLSDRGQLYHENCVIITKTSEKPAIQEEG